MFGDLRAIKRIVTIIYVPGRNVHYYNLEERDPEPAKEWSSDGCMDLVTRWLDGLSNQTAQVFKRSIIEKIENIQNTRLKAKNLLDLAQKVGPKFWIKRLSALTIKWIAQYPILARWSIMSYDDNTYY